MMPCGGNFTVTREVRGVPGKPEESKDYWDEIQRTDAKARCGGYSRIVCRSLRRHKNTGKEQDKKGSLFRSVSPVSAMGLQGVVGIKGH